jgi:hypothetical protein
MAFRCATAAHLFFTEQNFDRANQNLQFGADGKAGHDRISCRLNDLARLIFKGKLPAGAIEI